MRGGGKGITQMLSKKWAYLGAFTRGAYRRKNTVKINAAKDHSRIRIKVKAAPYLSPYMCCCLSLQVQFTASLYHRNYIQRSYFCLVFHKLLKKTFPD